VKQVVVISGKGGTGKTVLTASFAALARGAVLADVDVDASNLHLLLRPEILEKHVFRAGHRASIDAEQCTGCGLCLPVCRFGALSEGRNGLVVLDPLFCEGCGVCRRVCPQGAVSLEPRASGELCVSSTAYGPLVHARLGAAEANSGKLVTEVRKHAARIAESEGRGLLLMDGSPGIGCPVIASLTGTDLALIVTEPTPSGLHDMERIFELTRHFKIRAACCINKHDLHAENTARVEAWCRERSIPVAGKIPFDPAVPESVVKRVPFVEHSSNSTAGAIRKTWFDLLERLA
jgi:MinD superfamily P-loop ATPase